MSDLPSQISTHQYAARFSFNEVAKKTALIPVNGIIFLLEALSSSDFNALWPDKKRAWAQAEKQSGDIYQITEYTQAVELNGFYQSGAKKVIPGYFSPQEAVEWLKDKEQSYIAHDQERLRELRSSHFTSTAANLNMGLK